MVWKTIGDTVAAILNRQLPKFSEITGLCRTFCMNAVFKGPRQAFYARFGTGCAIFFLFFDHTKLQFLIRKCKFKPFW
jgi:hypothetical protein